MSNPFEVPPEQQDKNTGDEELSAKSGSRNIGRQTGNLLQIDQNMNDWGNQQPLEEKKMAFRDQP